MCLSIFIPTIWPISSTLSSETWCIKSRWCFCSHGTSLTPQNKHVFCGNQSQTTKWIAFFLVNPMAMAKLDTILGEFQGEFSPIWWTRRWDFIVKFYLQIWWISPTNLQKITKQTKILQEKVPPNKFCPTLVIKILPPSDWDDFSAICPTKVGLRPQWFRSRRVAGERCWLVRVVGAVGGVGKIMEPLLEKSSSVVDIIFNSRLSRSWKCHPLLKDVGSGRSSTGKVEVFCWEDLVFFLCFGYFFFRMYRWTYVAKVFVLFNRFCCFVYLTLSTGCFDIYLHRTCHLRFRGKNSCTPPKFNIEPENQPLEKEIPIGNDHFQVPW